MRITDQAPFLWMGTLRLRDCAAYAKLYGDKDKWLARFQIQLCLILQTRIYTPAHLGSGEGIPGRGTVKEGSFAEKAGPDLRSLCFSPPQQQTSEGSSYCHLTCRAPPGVGRGGHSMAGLPGSGQCLSDVGGIEGPPPPQNTQLGNTCKCSL